MGTVSFTGFLTLILFIMPFISEGMILYGLWTVAWGRKDRVPVVSGFTAMGVGVAMIVMPILVIKTLSDSDGGSFR